MKLALALAVRHRGHLRLPGWLSMLKMSTLASSITRDNLQASSLLSLALWVLSNAYVRAHTTLCFTLTMWRKHGWKTEDEGIHHFYRHTIHCLLQLPAAWGWIRRQVLPLLSLLPASENVQLRDAMDLAYGSSLSKAANDDRDRAEDCSSAVKPGTESNILRIAITFKQVKFQIVNHE